jgi:hypothetical protein
MVCQQLPQGIAVAGLRAGDQLVVGFEKHGLANYDNSEGRL